MLDNNPRDQYFYMISVYTGMRAESGTKSRVGFTLVGENGDTGIRQMADGLKKVRFLKSTYKGIFYIILQQIDT